MRRTRILLSAILAGLCVGFGGLAFLSLDNKVIGSAAFTIGLFVICTFGFHLFTGKVCYVLQNDRDYALDLPVIWLGNLIGTGLTAGTASLTRIAPALREKAVSLCQVKVNDSLLSLFLLGLLCNIFIYLAVDGYNRLEMQSAKVQALFFGVSVFVICGYEHCVADMFYFWMAGLWSGRAILSVLIITLGNAVGGVLFATLHRIVRTAS